MALINEIKKFFITSKFLLKTFRKYRKNFLIVTILGFLGGISGAFGAGALIPLFYLITGQQIAGIDFITRTISSIFSFLHIPFTLYYLIALMSVLFIFKGIIQFSIKYLNQKISTDFEIDARFDVFKNTIQSSWPYLLEHKLGFLEKLLMKEITIVSGIISQISGIVFVSANFAVYAFVAFKISAPITILTTVFGIIMFLTLRPILKKMRRLSERIRGAEKQMAHFINESIVGSKIIKASASEPEVVAAGNIYLKQFRDDAMKIFFYRSWVNASLEPISFCFIALLMLWSHNSPGFNIGAFAAIVYLIQRMFSFIQTGQVVVQDLFTNIPYIQSLACYKKEVNASQEPETGGKFKFKEKIEFKNVKFSYSKDREILAGVSFIINKGEMIGLIGSSGSGKTTIADLLMQLFRPEEGEITVDGKNIADTSLRSWRKNIGYMPQDPFLLNDTIENNIRFYNSKMSSDEIEYAVKTANIYDFVEELPEGLQTIVGERGVKISAGQRQRIMLARALAKKPEILILDEATSALDNQSDMAIQKSIDDLRGKITILVIAHRLSTIMSSDRLLILENGKIVEEGLPNELLHDKDTHFYKIYNIVEQN